MTLEKKERKQNLKTTKRMSMVAKMRSSSVVWVAAMKMGGLCSLQVVSDEGEDD